MKKILAVIIVFIFLFILSETYKRGVVPTKTQVTEPKKETYLLDYSEGACNLDENCQWAGEGCGGGHGVCTDNPEKYKGAITTCDVNEKFPANQGYTCGCIAPFKKCGWKK